MGRSENKVTLMNGGKPIITLDGYRFLSEEGCYTDNYENGVWHVVRVQNCENDGIVYVVVGEMVENVWGGAFADKNEAIKQAKGLAMHNATDAGINLW